MPRDIRDRCLHRVRFLNPEDRGEYESMNMGYRYVCTVCKRLLKIASGIFIGGK